MDWGTPKRKGVAGQDTAVRGFLLDKPSPASKAPAPCSTDWASPHVRANTDTQSSVRQAGTMPRVLMRPRVGFKPIKLLKAAGTRPEPAVSVPKEKLTRPSATATAEPELDPPEM